MKTVQIGAWDGDQPTITVPDNATVQDALRIAGMSLASTQQIVSYTNSENVGVGDSVLDGETYILTGNQVSG